MSEAELPNLDELEEIKGKNFTKRVALTTAIFAVILAIASLGGKNTTKEALLAQQQASDQWAFYQAKVIREHLYGEEKLRLEADLAERGSTMKPQVRQKFEALMTKFADEERRYSTEKKDIEKEAKKLEHERDINRDKDPYFDYAEVFLQIAIVMSSISIISTSRPLFFFSLALAIFGALLTLNGYTLFIKIPFLHSSH
jgi:uncharacterized protein DUF4337